MHSIWIYTVGWGDAMRCLNRLMNVCQELDVQKIEVIAVFIIVVGYLIYFYAQVRSVQVIQDSVAIENTEALLI